MSGCGTRIVLRGQKPLALCDRCPCFGSLFLPLAALAFAASSIICAFGLASAAPRLPYTSNDIKDFDALGAHLRSISEPTPEMKAIYEKWRGKTFNQRHEAFSMLASEHHVDCADAKRIWWQHIFEDEKVEVNPNYLDRISGMHDRALTYKAEQIGKKRRGW